nr:unnamed protein product [Digitaria exilis]
METSDSRARTRDPEQISKNFPPSPPPDAANPTETSEKDYPPLELGEFLDERRRRRRGEEEIRWQQEACGWGREALIWPRFYSSPYRVRVSVAAKNLFGPLGRWDPPRSGFAAVKARAIVGRAQGERVDSSRLGDSGGSLMFQGLTGGSLLWWLTRRGRLGNLPGGLVYALYTHRTLHGRSALDQPLPPPGVRDEKKSEKEIALTFPTSILQFGALHRWPYRRPGKDLATIQRDVESSTEFRPVLVVEHDLVHDSSRHLALSVVSTRLGQLGTLVPFASFLVSSEPKPHRHLPFPQLGGLVRKLICASEPFHCPECHAGSVPAELIKKQGIGVSCEHILSRREPRHGRFGFGVETPTAQPHGLKRMHTPHHTRSAGAWRPPRRAAQLLQLSLHKEASERLIAIGDSSASLPRLRWSRNRDEIAEVRIPFPTMG